MEIHLTLGEGDEKKLEELVEIHNRGLGPESRKTKQEYFEELVREALYFKWKLLRS